MNAKEFLRISVLSIATCWSANASAASAAGVEVDQDGTVHVPAYAVPLSIYMSDEAKRTYKDLRLNWPANAKTSGDLLASRKAIQGWLEPQLERAKAVYAVTVEDKKIGGVQTDVVTPKGGVAKQNGERVLINIHGGGYYLGSRTLGLIEAIPIAATGKIKVITIDYRQAPEHKYPAASQDIVAVYRELLKQYKPHNIGIYGHSTGGTLTASSMAWFQKEKLPLPGAIGIFSAHGVSSGGDFYYMATPLGPLFNSRSAAPAPASKPVPMNLAYMAGADVNDPLVSPLGHPSVLAKFPPTLIVTGTRDSLASFLIHTHRELVRAGVDSQLELWESMWHGFVQHVDLPESKEMYAVTAKFFDRHLGKARR